MPGTPAEVEQRQRDFEREQRRLFEKRREAAGRVNARIGTVPITDSVPDRSPSPDPAPAVSRRRSLPVIDVASDGDGGADDNS